MADDPQSLAGMGLKPTNDEPLIVPARNYLKLEPTMQNEQTIEPTIDQAFLVAAAAADGIELAFASEGPSYERAKAVADRLGLDMRTYLLACLHEGHKVLKVRSTLPSLPKCLTDPLEEPAYRRRGNRLLDKLLGCD